MQVKHPNLRALETRYEIKVAENEVLAERALLQAAEQTLFLDVPTTLLDTIGDEAIFSFK